MTIRESVIRWLALSVLVACSACSSEHGYHADRNTSAPTEADQAAVFAQARGHLRAEQQPQYFLQQADEPTEAMSDAEGLQESDMPGDAGKSGRHAVAQVPCGSAGAIETECRADVIRKWSNDGTILVEITKPGGSTRALFFDRSGAPIGADSAQADGSAGWTLVPVREGDATFISYGPERFRIPDALILGG